ncbi:hypothetical protein A3709_12010 [Halioglobus sp. HI00S01]|uniref:FAD-binding oxidoreductase n=1 Tax=Halioglobus sp. HI00S01 TaxID=1822214 RepID=UPI0007C397DE|nr:FAD-binding oxidoreductase [Halioglobus sp. HI00S01]KZX60309.1 hypothetical protein A3709_12010 [Halioglobus sp. HI00S01]
MLKIEQQTSPLYDYGKLYGSEYPYNVCYPSTISEVQNLVLEAIRCEHKLRVRGSGHTFNGCTLPRGNEILIRTEKLNWFRYEERGTVTVGCGALVWDIRDLVAEQGFTMPVYNGGWAGPTLGGYINAGGFGKGSLSDEHGGLWENILSITFVDGTGQLHCIDRRDERFKWLFASYGQLGIFVEAKLRLAPRNGLANLLYPLDYDGIVPKRQTEDPRENDHKQGESEEILFWFSLLVRPEAEKVAWNELRAFCLRHTDALTPDGGWAGPTLNGTPIGYHYNIKFLNFMPPLLYSRNEAFLVVGVMCILSIDAVSDNDHVLTIEQDFIALAERNDFELYLQAENIGRNVKYRNYYSADVYAKFCELKKAFDPGMIINSGTFFSAEDA